MRLFGDLTDLTSVKVGHDERRARSSRRVEGTDSCSRSGHIGAATKPARSVFIHKCGGQSGNAPARIWTAHLRAAAQVQGDQRGDGGHGGQALLAQAREAVQTQLRSGTPGVGFRRYRGVPLHGETRQAQRCRRDKAAAHCIAWQTWALHLTAAQMIPCS